MSNWRVTSETVNRIADASEEVVMTLFDCATVVSWRLPNGFILTEQSACVDPANYSEEVGIEICRQRLVSRIWELEGYQMQTLYHAEQIQREGTK